MRVRRLSHAQERSGWKTELPSLVPRTQRLPSHGLGGNGKLFVTFDAGSAGPGSPSFSASENIVHAVEKDGVYDFLILTNGNSATLQTVFALSRSTTFSEEYKAKWDKFIRDTGYSVVDEIYEVPHPKECYYGGPGGSPPVLKRFDATKASGFWYQHKIDIGQLVFQGKDTICAALQFDKMNGYLRDTAVSQQSSTGSKVRVLEGVKIYQDDAEYQGKLRILFPPGAMYKGAPSFNSSSWVLDAKEEGGRYSYYIGSSGEEAYSAFFFNSRSRVVPADTMKYVVDFIAKTHFYGEIVDILHPSSCNYGPLSPLPPSANPAASDEKVQDGAMGIMSLSSLIISFSVQLALTYQQY